jgi:hypothetical protein
LTALQLGNCDLVRLRGTSDGGGATCARALATRTREGYGAERFNEVRKAACEAGHDTSPSLRDVRVAPRPELSFQV